MSRLSEILCVKEGQEFRHGAKQRTYKVVGENFYQKKDGQGGWEKYSHKFIDIINRPDLIHPIPQKINLTEHQITAIKGRIAEGTPWVARDQAGTLYAYENKPKLSQSQTYFYSKEKYGFPIESDLYDFITFENSPVYLPDLIEEEEE